MFHTTKLVPLLHERGIQLSGSQVHRLVTGTPERLSLPVLAALCDALEVTPADLIVTDAANAARAPRPAALPSPTSPDAARHGPASPPHDRPPMSQQR